MVPGSLNRNKYKLPRTVAYVHDTTAYGGVEIFLLHLIKHLDPQRYTPVVLVPGYTDEYRSSPPRFIQQIQDLGLPLIRMPIRTEIPVIGGISQVQEIKKLIQDREFDVVHIHTCRPTGARIPTISAWLSGVKAILRTEHMAPSAFVKPWTPLEIMPLDRMTDFILTVSDANLEEQVRLLRRDRKKLYRSYAGIEFDRFQREHDTRTAKKEIGIDPDIPVVGMVGRLSAEKGHTYLLRAAPRIIQEYGSVKFLIVGDGPIGQQIKQAVTDLGLDAYFQFTGFLPDPKLHMEAMDVGVMPSTSEAFGLAVLEFMALGVPTITSSLPCFKEVIIDGKSGIITSLEEEGNLANSILKLLREPEMASRIGQAASSHVPSRFSAQRLAEDMMDLYDKVIQSKSCQ